MLTPIYRGSVYCLDFKKRSGELGFDISRIMDGGYAFQCYRYFILHLILNKSICPIKY